MLNINFEKKVVVDTEQQSWQKSPASGIWRKPLARAEAERGHATSVVKYEAGSDYPEHGHPNGEEIFVLEGVFSDETGDYPAGSYIRNPEGFSHRPFSVEGCTIFVKLYQFQSNDNEQVRINTNQVYWSAGKGNLKVIPLHSFEGESTALVHWPAGEKFMPHTHMGGEEIFVIRGELIDEHGRYPAGSWIRSPHLSQHYPYVELDTVILVKVGHL
ncbi:cupin domain-containing protein [Shewanella sp. SG41-4]|uniref:cupin domain-containing protein n=1 Tax=Shewanella sp. SG41-4 TaxID=2760976 RepID=UPI001601FF57|nr:cupin domain-containing protein [Shewanella sp. SG41-4]MBB1440979.1 cupin domain-containing protein [Shewanella sp. SG41-4]